MPVLAGTVLRCVGLSSSLWADEVYTLQLARLGWLDILREPDQTPPLFALLLHAWLPVAGDSEWALRLPSLAASVATVPVAALLARRVADARTATFAAWLCATNPLLVLQGHELRAYALFTLLCVAGPLLLVRAAQDGRRRDRVAWSVTAALALLTHAYAPLFVAGQAVFWWVALRDRLAWRTGLAMSVLPAVAFAAWLPVLVDRARYVTGGFWIESPGIAVVAVTLCALAGGWLALAVHGAAWLVRRPRMGWGWAALVLLPVVVPLLVSLAVPVFTVRYAVPAVALAAVPLARSLSRFRFGLARPAAAVAIVATLLSVPAVGTIPYPLAFSQDWRGAVEHVEASAGPGDVLVWMPGLCDSGRPMGRDLTCPWGVYGRRDDVAHVGFGDPARRPGPESLPDLAQRLDGARPGTGNNATVWLVQAETSVPDAFLQEWLAQRLGSGDVAWRADGVLVVAYGARP